MADGETILVVEDNADMRAFVHQVLQERGFAIQEATTGWKALQLAANLNPDVLLLDWQLPDITGLDVLQALRAGHCGAPAILMTGYGSEALAITALRLGVRQYLRKPFEAEELIDAIDTALVEGRLRRESERLKEQLAQANQQRDAYVQRLVLARQLLGGLVRLTEDLKRGPGTDWSGRVQEIRRTILQIGEVLAVPSSSAGQRQNTPKR